ncbi:IgGFc-binding protein-like [Pecten maximus]|uniref:IgGFc-binding protein-like n=1 Tax=Pecten maximus TaxID=6579 RepID=UPI001458073B|nr:IgGFc-binding protein-like [Pecten maximus]
MGVTLGAVIFLCGCMTYVVSTGKTTIAFSKNDVRYVTLYVNVLNPLDTCASVNISAPGVGTFATRFELVEPKNVTVIELNNMEFEMTETGKTDKGILIQSNISEIIIIGLSSADKSAAMFYARNATQHGSEYVTLTHCEEDDICQFAIIAGEDNTSIEMLFPEYLSGSVLFDGTEYGPGDVMDITLRESQTFQIQSTFDLSGVNILSTNGNQFSVLSGSAFTGVQTSTTREHLADMVPPVEAWGNQFILVRRNLTDYLRDEVRFVAAGSGANISIFGCGPVLNRSIPGFQIFFYRMTCERVHIISDEPVLVAHFPVGIYHGDPAMFFPTPIHHYASEYFVYIPPGFRECAVAVVMETIHTSTFDLTRFTDSFTDWNEIEHSVYSTAWLKNMKSGVLEITHTSPFGGHVVCERDFAMIALTIGLGNVTLNGPQLYSPTAITDSSSTQSVYETSISTERP